MIVEMVALLLYVFGYSYAGANDTQLFLVNSRTIYFFEINVL